MNLRLQPLTFKISNLFVKGFLYFVYLGLKI